MARQHFYFEAQTGLVHFDRPKSYSNFYLYRISMAHLPSVNKAVTDSVQKSAKVGTVATNYHETFLGLLDAWDEPVCLNCGHVQDKEKPSQTCPGCVMIVEEANAQYQTAVAEAEKQEELAITEATKKRRMKVAAEELEARRKRKRKFEKGGTK